MNPGRNALSLALAALAVALGGCHAALEPTAQERRASFRLRQGSFRGDTVQSVLQTYLVIAAGPAGGPPSVDPSSGAIRLPAAGPGAYKQGLAVGFDRDGYLLTSRHILRERIYVVGWMNGRLDVRPGRVVALGSPSDPGSDFAVLAVEARLDYAASLGARPARGDPVFAIVCERARGTIGGELDLAAGNVLSGCAPGTRDPGITTDVPLWYGDSGGPLLSADGRLVGVNSAIHFAWSEGGALIGGYVRLSSFADGALLAGVVAADKARIHGGAPVRRGPALRR